MALRALGFTQASWDNLSGQEKQPSSVEKYWDELTDKEKAAATVLGYTATTWDNESGSEPQPASADKSWNELRSCGESHSFPTPSKLSPNLNVVTLLPFRTAYCVRRDNKEFGIYDDSQSFFYR